MRGWVRERVAVGAPRRGPATRRPAALTAGAAPGAITVDVLTASNQSRRLRCGKQIFLRSEELEERQWCFMREFLDEPRGRLPVYK